MPITIMRLKINNGIEIGDVEIATASFKELALKENDVEEFLRKNIGVIFGEEEVRFNDENLTYNQWGQKVIGWSSICIYEWAIHKETGKSLDVLRRKKMEQIESETSDNTA